MNIINPNPAIPDIFQPAIQTSAVKGHAYQRTLEGTGFAEDFLDLFLQAGDSFVADLNLFIGGHGIESSGDLDLFLCNNNIGADLDLCISGAGENDDWYYTSSSLNLYLEAPTSNVLDLVLWGPGIPVDESLDLFIHGADIITGNLNLVLNGTVAEINSETLPLYINGLV